MLRLKKYKTKKTPFYVEPEEWKTLLEAYNDLSLLSNEIFLKILGIMRFFAYERKKLQEWDTKVISPENFLPWTSSERKEFLDEIDTDWFKGKFFTEMIHSFPKILSEKVKENIQSHSNDILKFSQEVRTISLKNALVHGPSFPLFPPTHSLNASANASFSFVLA